MRFISEREESGWWNDPEQLCKVAKAEAHRRIEQMIRFGCIDSEDDIDFDELWNTYADTMLKAFSEGKVVCTRIDPMVIGRHALTIVTDDYGYI